MKIGVYSERAAALCGTFFYAKPGGGDVEVTEVCTPDSLEGYAWPDKKIVGEVGAFLRTGQQSKLERFNVSSRGNKR